MTVHHKAGCAALLCEGISYRFDYTRLCKTHGERPFPTSDCCPAFGPCDCGADLEAAARTVREFQTDPDSLRDQETDPYLRHEREQAEARLDALLARLQDTQA